MQRQSRPAMPRMLKCFAAAWLVSQVGCATILSEKRYPVIIDNPHGPTFFSVQDRQDKVIHQGVTPQQVTLDAKYRPFWPAKYTVVYAGTESTTQRRELKAGFDPWIAGNLIVGGGVGLVVDGATGAMFKLPKRVEGDIPAQFAVTDHQLGAHLAAISPPIENSSASAPTSIAEKDNTATPTVRQASSVQR
ncbi:MAG: hypothetical protein ACO1RT_09765 [Planctomycetaceae bacterium]